jgi:hypothetical protein
MTSSRLERSNGSSAVSSVLKPPRPGHESHVVNGEEGVRREQRKDSLFHLAAFLGALDQRSQFLKERPR